MEGEIPKWELALILVLSVTYSYTGGFSSSGVLLETAKGGLRGSTFGGTIVSVHTWGGTCGITGGGLLWKPYNKVVL